MKIYVLLFTSMVCSMPSRASGALKQGGKQLGRGSEWCKTPSYMPFWPRKRPDVHSFPLVFDDRRVWHQDPQALAAVVAGSGGALCLGSVGAVVGATVGAASGLCLGAVPALFTLGLSLPLGALLGGTSGVLCGAMVGSSAGFVGGGSSGMFFAYFRKEFGAKKAMPGNKILRLRSGAVYISARLYDVYDLLVARPTNAVKVGSEGHAL